MLRMERKRTGRSGKPFLLMLINLSGLQTRQYSSYLLERIKEALDSSSRETDIRGWYEHSKIMGAIFTEMSSVDNATIEKIFKKLYNNISNSLGTELLKKIEISLHVFKFPEEEQQRTDGVRTLIKKFFILTNYPPQIIIHKNVRTQEYL